MRVLLTIVLLLTGVSIDGSSTSARVMCEDIQTPTAATPSASPETSSHPMASFPESGGTLTVFAAASLTDAFNEIADGLMAEHPNLTITIQTAGSQTLVTQLEEGAPADVLATANTSTMDRAVEAGLIESGPFTFTGNRLVIVTPAGNPAGIASIDDLAQDDLRLVLANPDVPAGRYSADAFCAYATQDGAPDQFIDAVNANIVSEEPDVRHVLAKVQLGEADAGVVYASDAVTSRLAGVELEVIEFPANVPTRAEYPIAVVADANTDLAEAFISYVLSDDGQAILAKYGFE